MISYIYIYCCNKHIYHIQRFQSSIFHTYNVDIQKAGSPSFSKLPFFKSKLCSFESTLVNLEVCCCMAFEH